MKNIRRFGTFDGVFLPTILSIFGVILFLRTGWVVGNAGLVNALIILFIAEMIALATALSLSAISTNIEVGGGGVYYIISRSLGVNTGGAIGIPLYLSQAISIAFYIIGFLESLKIMGINNLDMRLWGTIVLLLFSFMAYHGADFAVKLQYLIFSLLVLGILSFFLYPHWIPLKENIVPHYYGNYNFWKVFAVFFPAVTGITAGIGLSGELKEPGKNIPRGTIMAVIAGAIVYALVMWKAASVELYTRLISDTGVFIEKSMFPGMVMLGIWAATISSALTFTLGAPRTLKALSDDGVIPRIFASTLGSPNREPRMGVIVSFFIAEAFILLGSLNSVAIVITMFFLITYGVSNYSAGIQELIGNPSYRPRFRVHWLISLIGFAGSIFVMFLISPTGMVVAILSIFIIYLLLKRKGLHQTWGDVRAGLWISLARFALLKLEHTNLDPLNWRPNIMVFTGNPETRPYLARMAEWLSRGRGIVTYFNLIECCTNKDYLHRKEELQKLKEFIHKNRLTAFAEIEVVERPWESIPCIAQAHGIGKLYSNVAMFGWGKHFQRDNRVIDIIRKLVWLNRDVLILKYCREKGFGEMKTIDIWWGGKGGNIELMLLMAHIILMNYEWKEGRLRVVRVVNRKEDVDREREITLDRLFRARMNGDVKIVLNDNHKPLKNLMQEVSGDSDLIVMGLPVPGKGEERIVAERIEHLISSLGSVLMVRSTFKKEVFI